MILSTVEILRLLSSGYKCNEEIGAISLFLI